MNSALTRGILLFFVLGMYVTQPSSVLAQSLTIHVDQMLAGGTCSGSCGAGSCSSGTPQSSCECRGKGNNCKCKGNTKCYSPSGVLLETVPCSGTCSWKKNSAELSEAFAEFLIELIKEEERNQSVSSFFD